MVLQDKLNALLEKYQINKDVQISSDNKIIIDGKEIPLLPWRHERRFIELKNMVRDGTLADISTIKACRIDKKNVDLNHVIYRELDLCQWFTGSEVVEAMAFKNSRTANIIAKLENGVICTVEAAVTLCEEAVPIDKHEIISKRGIACDRVVDTQIPQQSVYVYENHKHPTTYTDVDFELFGLNAEDVAFIRQAIEVAKNDSLTAELIESANKLNQLIVLTDLSAEKVCNMKVGRKE